MFADLVLVDGNVITMDSSKPTAQALAIKKDRIVKVGTNNQINSLVGNSTKVINLQGKSVVPGFIDSHIHVADFGKFLTWLDLTAVTSIKELQAKLREHAQNIPKNRWIIGNGWDQACFAEKRYPDLHDLNEASPDNPVILYHQCGRVCVVNSKALDLAGVTNKTFSPLGGTLEKDPKTGELTGILRENATDLVWKTIPEPSNQELIESASLACKKIVASGITSIHWIVSSANEIKVIQSLASQNKLPLRVHIIAPATLLNQLDSLNSLLGSGDNSTRLLGFKIFVDGSLAARTAALTQPYLDQQSTTGQLLYSQEELDSLVAKAHKAHLGLVIHAMGDKAINMALTAIEKVLMDKPKTNHRYRIEHASVLNKELISRIKKLGMIISIQPKCALSEFLVWSAVERLGNSRARLLYPLKTLVNEGIRIIGGSDCPMEPLSPLLGMQAAVTRPFFPEEQLTVDEALRMYTINAAYASCDDAIKGSIEEGKLADLAVLSGDPRTSASSKIGEIKVAMTLVSGKVVYQNLP
ncbi:MAG: amidohydrolase [Candidatus Bathyarchaeota archaeon]|nr:amidohydrolase [Candidatus Bathyarchaeum sp.]